jgi:hypothetical protein
MSLSHNSSTELLDSETGADHWREMSSGVPCLPVRDGIEIASNKLFDLTQDKCVIVIREAKDTKGNTRGRIKFEGKFGWTTIVDVDGNVGLRDTGKVLGSDGSQRVKRASKASLAVSEDGRARAGSGRFSSARQAAIQIDEDETEEDFMLSMGIGGDESGPDPPLSRKKRSSLRKTSVSGGDDVIEGASEAEASGGGSVFVMPTEELGDEEESKEPEGQFHLLFNVCVLNVLTILTCAFQQLKQPNSWEVLMWMVMVSLTLM